LAHPFDLYNRFTTGNLETLLRKSEILGVNLRDVLIKFYKKHYLVDKMKLVIQSRESLNEIEDMVNGIFNVLENKEYNNEFNKELNNKNHHLKAVNNANETIKENKNLKESTDKSVSTIGSVGKLMMNKPFNNTILVRILII